MLEQVQARLGYRFRDPALLARALTHASARSEQVCNERLEFLGDAVLGLVVAEHLFHARPDEAEGVLTQLRAHAVSTSALADWGDRLGLGAAVALGKGLDREQLPASVLANAVEAVLAAVYLDAGLDAVRGLVTAGLSQRLEADGELTRDWKSLLQEQTQQAAGELPLYELIAEAGPDHDKRFEVRVLVAGQERGRGQGTSKKDAEQSAAKAAYSG